MHGQQNIKKLINCPTIYRQLRSVKPNCTSKERHEQKTFFCFNVISGILLEDKRTFYFCWRHTFATKALSCDSQYFCTVDSDM